MDINNIIAFSVMFAPFGVYHVVHNLLYPMMMTKRGFVKVTRQEPNSRTKFFWAKPEYSTPNGGVIKTGKGDKAEALPFLDSPDATYFEGGAKCVFYNAKGEQVKPSGNAIKAGVIPAILDMLMVRYFNAGKARVFKDEKEQAGWLKLMPAVAALVGIATIAYVISLGKQIEAIQATLEILRQAAMKA